MSKQGVGASLLTKNELGSIPRCTANNLFPGGVMVTQLTLTQSFLVRAQAGVPSLRILTANLIQLSIGEKECILFYLLCKH